MTVAEVQNQTAMRVLGVLIFIGGIIQIGVSGAAYSLTSWGTGAWWAGALCVVSAICAVISTDRCAVIAGLIFSIIAIILVIVGLILDGISYGMTNGLDTCYNQETGVAYGDKSPSNGLQIANCVYGHSQTCLCINASQDSTCYLFNLKSGDDCGVILDKLPSLLIASVIFLAFLFVSVLTYSAFTCKTVCCGSPDALANAPPSPAGTAAPAATAVASPVANKA